ncbi:MAG: VWA domain-containing protein, partial [Gammaproteobacteria bacterium]|nr:VWA domain-containing protein [Gammaproteobacteria bacterium]
AMGLLAWSTVNDRPRYSYSLNENPVAISIAFDLSPSMLAIPDPSVSAQTQTRFERGRERLSELFRELEDRQENIIVSMSGFTEKAQVILGWESNIAQINEMLDFVISPELFTSTGTSIEAAINSLAGSFNTLPQNLREKSHKIGILVSDGEDTLPYSYLEYAVEKVETSSFDMITLQTGLLGENEGVPEYGEFGEFLHFTPMSGRLFTVPNVDTMMQLSQIDSHRGLYVRAESPESVDRMLRFIGGADSGTGNIDKSAAILLALFLIIALIFARLIL